MPLSRNTSYALGASMSLVGAFLLYHQLNQYLARRKLDKLRAQAVAGQIPTTQFLNAVLASGQPAVPGAPKVTVSEAARMPCSAVFPLGVATLPEFAAALAELKRNGTCL